MQSLSRSSKIKFTQGVVTTTIEVKSDGPEQVVDDSVIDTISFNTINSIMQGLAPALNQLVAMFAIKPVDAPVACRSFENFDLGSCRVNVSVDLELVVDINCELAKSIVIVHMMPTVAAAINAMIGHRQLQAAMEAAGYTPPAQPMTMDQLLAQQGQGGDSQMRVTQIDGNHRSDGPTGQYL